jgi:hypothetical protein
VDRDRDLAQVLPAFPAVLHDGPRGAVPVAHERVVVDQPGIRHQQPHRTGGDPLLHLAVAPRRPADEVAQVLPGQPEPLGHRLDRLALPVQQQTAHAVPAVLALPRIGEVLEDIPRELGQVGTQLRDGTGVHAPTLPPARMIPQPFRSRIMTKPCSRGLTGQCSHPDEKPPMNARMKTCTGERCVIRRTAARPIVTITPLGNAVA